MELAKIFRDDYYTKVGKVLTQKKREKSCNPYLVHCRVCIIPSYQVRNSNRFGLTENKKGRIP